MSDLEKRTLYGDHGGGGGSVELAPSPSRVQRERKMCLRCWSRCSSADDTRTLDVKVGTETKEKEEGGDGYCIM